MITCNNQEHGREYSSSMLKVFIDNRERFFTVYDLNDKPMYTITRPLTYDRTSRWEVADTNGNTIAKRVHGARAAFVCAVWHLQKKLDRVVYPYAGT